MKSDVFDSFDLAKCRDQPRLAASNQWACARTLLASLGLKGQRSCIVECLPEILGKKLDRK